MDRPNEPAPVDDRPRALHVVTIIARCIVAASTLAISTWAFAHFLFR